MKILVTGASGQLGYDVCRELEKRGTDYRGVCSKDFRLDAPEGIRSYLMGYAPDAVIHCGAYTAVDRAEDEPALCAAVNSMGTRVLAECCRELGAKLLYISTDYVFPGGGCKPYEVWDKTGPLNVYGRTKLEGELAVREYLETYFIVRTSWVFGLHGHNFVRAMLDLGTRKPVLGITGDQFGSPTYTRDLAPLLCGMVLTECYGVYHATNEGICTWAEFAREIFRQTGMAVSVTAQKAAERPGKAVRPQNSRMSKKSLADASFPLLPRWEDALSRYLEELRRLGDHV